MKYFKQKIKTFLLVFLAIFSTGFTTEIEAKETIDMTASTSERDSLLKRMKHVEISLLTCSPGEQVWSLYGHTAIRYTDHISGEDLAVNYGMFSFSQDYFILRFVFGRTDYQMGIEPFSSFAYEYASQGRTVIQQRLHLSAEEKLNITIQLIKNYQPANRVYRYNFFYDNCTTRARDILINNLIRKKINFQANPNVNVSFREMIHQWNNEHRWARFGNDLLLGVKADLKTNNIQQQFLPDSLRRDFDKATLTDASGKTYQLVDSTFNVVEPTEAVVGKVVGIWDIITPQIAFATLLVITIIISIFELQRRKTFWLYDTLLLSLDGLAGLCLFAMIFSSHPTVQVNIQILMLNPLSIIFAYSVGKNAFHQRYNRYWTILAVCILLFFFGNIFQHPAEGMNFLACSLMVRCYINYKLYKNNTKSIR